MKLKKQFLLTILTTAAVILGLTACDNGDAGPRYIGQTGAQLLSVTIGALEFGPEADEPLPERVGGSDWDFSGFDLYSADYQTAEFNREQDVTNIRIKALVSPRAWAEWGIGSRSARPDTFFPTGIPITFSTDDFLYIKVSSEDGQNFNYYRFYTRVFSSVTHLAGLSIDGVKGTVRSGGGNWDNALEGSISIAAAQKNKAIEYETFDANATAKFAKLSAAVADANDAKSSLAEKIAPVFGAANTLDFADQDVLYVEVTAQNTIDKAYYRFRVSVGRVATIKTLRFVHATDVEDEDGNKGALVVGKGTPGREVVGETVDPEDPEAKTPWDSVSPGSFETAKNPATFTIAIELDDPAAEFWYTKLDAIDDDEPAWTPKTTTAITFEVGEALAIKVVSDNEMVTMFYKIRLDLMAGVFKVQPLSAYYYYYETDPEKNKITGSKRWVKGSNPDTDPDKVVDLATPVTTDWYEYHELTVNATDPAFSNTVKALSFELEGIDDLSTANLSYQWYQSNSWYGGYGFDKDGRILFFDKKDTSPAASNPIIEDGFIESPYHRQVFDEKNNVSLHNGGNQFYRLPIRGDEDFDKDGVIDCIIPNETGATYTPKIDYRPFIGGYTSESHYYWVVITDNDTGRTLTSKRAVIVSERDPRKKHYIVNMNAYLDTTGKTPGLQENPANINPFTYHRETRLIPVTFSSDFFVMNYSVCTAQALFFLADGRPWIQNWTQADFGFADEDKVEKILWYNLTNDNGTYGLHRTGKSPPNSSLEVTPAYIIVKPAGEKPPDEMPPYNPDGTIWVNPIEKDRDAQGWFTPYIELTEIRFEGPGRE